MPAAPATSADASRGFLASPWIVRLRSLFTKITIQRRERTLQVCETLSLGDRRFLAVVRCGEQRLLIGMTGQNICLLDRLPASISSPDRQGREVAGTAREDFQ